MRKSVFYMGQRFTVRHLNHVRSPLLTGYIRPSASTISNYGLLHSPLTSVSSVVATGAAGDLALPTSLSALSQLLSTVSCSSTLQSSGINFLAFKNISTCVFACEKVCLGFKQLRSHS